MFNKILFIVLIFIAGPAMAEIPVYESWGKAIRGYDPVAYFTQSESVKGEKDFTAEYEGATWYFSSAENKKLFQENPAKYAPQYGGHCAYAIGANGDLVSIDPDAWYIEEGKLYLNYSKKVQERWLEDKERYLEQGDKNWQKILAKKN